MPKRTATLPFLSGKRNGRCAKAFIMQEKAPVKEAARTRGGKDDLQSQVIDWLRFPLAVAVVFIHSFGNPPVEDISLLQVDPLTGENLFHWVRICLSHVATHIAVPTFFVISGYLFFRKVDNWNMQVYRKKMKSRFHTLVIPYLCWNLIAILITVGMKVGAFLLKGKPLSNILQYFQDNGWWHMLWDCNVWAEDRLNWLGMATPMSGPINLPLWFLRDLIVVVVLTPAIYWLLKHTRHYGLLLLGLAYVSGIWPNIPGLNITAVFFFSAGAYFSLRGKNLVDECRRVRGASYVCAAVLMLFTVWFDGRNTTTGCLIYPFYIIAGVCAAFNLAAQLLSSGRTHVRPVLSQSTFFIYAFHSLLALRISSFLFRPFDTCDSPAVQTMVYLLRPLLAVVVCLGLYLLMKRFIPRTLGLLTGNRG